MARKRRDNKRDKSTKQRVLGYTKAATGIAAGVAFFNRHGTRDFVAAKRTAKNISSDLLGKKKTLNNIVDSLDKNVGYKGEIYKKTRDSISSLNHKGTSKVSTNRTKSRGMMDTFKKSFEIANNKKDYIQQHHASKLEDLQARYKKQMLENKKVQYSDKDFSIVNEILRDTFYGAERHNTVYKLDNETIEKQKDFFTKKIQQLHSSISADDLIKDAYTTRVESNKEIVNPDIIQKFENLARTQADRLLEPETLKSIYKTNDTNKFATFNKTVKNITGIDINSQEFFQGSKNATLEDIYEEIVKFKQGNESQLDFNTFKVEIDNNGKKDLVDITNIIFEKMQDKDFREAAKDIQFGHGIKVSTLEDGTKHFYSTSEVTEVLENTFHEFAETLPGNLFKAMDIYQTAKAPVAYTFRAGTINVLSAFEENNNTNRIKNSYQILGDRVFKISGEGNFMQIEEQLHLRDKITVISGEHGSLPRAIKDMLGTDRTVANAFEDSILQGLDIGQSPSPNIFQRIKAGLTKHNNENWDRNKLKKARLEILDPESLMLETTEDFFKLQDRMDTVSTAFDEYTMLHQISDNTLAQLLEGNDKFQLAEENKRLVRLLLKGNIGEDLLTQEAFEQAQIGDRSYAAIFEVLSQKNVEGVNITSILSTVKNKSLYELFDTYTDDSDVTKNLLNITSKTNKVPGLGIDITRTTVLDTDDILRREVIKEILLRESADDPNRMYNAIARLDSLTGEQADALTALNSWSLFQNQVTSTSSRSAVDKARSYVTGLFSLNSDFFGDTSENISNNLSRIMNENYGIGSKPYFGNLSEQYTNDYSSYMAVKKSALSDMLFNMNIDRLGEVGKELIAGRNDVENISLLTTIPYGMVARLNYAVEELGIGLSMSSSGSALDLIKNIGLKRVLPIAGALSLYDYLDYESENFTGTSLTAAFAKGLANADMSLRQVGDATGVSSVLDWFKESSVIGEYYTGSRDFQSAEERAEWYEDGYSPVRSSRFWSFGSSSEFRGEGIAYWQPNYLKRAESNWREIGIYGSAEEKFKHSLLPSIRHPFSTINYILDPYWLEKKNIDERPYPYTGKMFTEGTPWGAVLNPTIGEIIKPVRMLPEIRERLNGTNVDIKTIIGQINERIKQRSYEYDDMFTVSGTDINNSVFTPYAYATPGYTNITVSNGNINSLQGVGYADNTMNLKDIDLSDITTTSDYAQSGSGISIKNAVAQYGKETGIDLGSILFGMNSDTQAKAAYRIGSDVHGVKDGVMINNNPVGNKLNSLTNYYAQKEDYVALQTTKHEDYINDALFSVGQLSGIYNFLGDMAFGENSYDLRMANAGEMYSFNRGFWDASFGGLGGGFMEIARRFFPHEDRSRPSINPLRNEMETWLPERFLTGDAYAALPKGEMRLPGKGYESIYNLHPDQFGQYGAFDRFKILADVAPTSEEYKIWRKIAKSTIQDPELMEEIKDIELRAKKAGMDHDFYEYRYINNPTENHVDYVKSISEDGLITVGSGRTLQLAGIAATGEAINEFLGAGDKITYKTVKDEVFGPDQISSKAIIYKKANRFIGVDNINKMIVDSGLGERDDLDDSRLAALATTDSIQETFGAVQEVIGHMKIPFIHNKLLKIESSFESYQNEMVYGSSFQTWDNPIESFIRPALNEQYRRGIIGEGITLAGWKYFKDTMENGTIAKKYGASAVLMMTNPAATLGGGIGWLSKMRFGKEALLGTEIGMAVGTIGWGIANADNPLTAMASFGMAGIELSKRLELDDFVKTASKEVAERAAFMGPIQKTIKIDLQERIVDLLGDKAGEFDHFKAGKVAAAVGLAVSALKNSDFDFNRLTGNWIPERTEKRWDLEEYNDRLEYVKYMGLYHESARRAKMLEGTDVNRIFAQLDQNKKEIVKLKRKAQKLGNKYIPGTPMHTAEMAKINAQIEALTMTDQAFKGGEWTKSAIAYKKMAESTVYGLSEASTIDEILRAAPDQYKDYVTAFTNETNKKRRKEILKYSSPQMKKLLQVAWGEKVDKQQSNGEYFKYHKLPGMAWRGWKPNVNLKHVHMKTIENEGLALSDFGYYDSEKAKASYYEAPDIERYDKKGFNFGILSRANLMMTMGGHGLAIENVSVETTSAPGLWILGDVSQRVNEVSHITSRGFDKMLNTLFL